MNESAESRGGSETPDEYERTIRRTEENLRLKIVEYEKLAALGRLTANVAHEIRNPITVIGGLAERLKKSTSFGEREREDLEVILTEAKRLEEILRDVLAFSDRASFCRERYDINGIVEESLSGYANICSDSSIHIRIVRRNVPQIYGDRRYLKEAINNLLSNAIDAMPHGGTLTAGVNKCSLGGRTYVSVKVSDTGVGIPQEKIGMIFEPFFTTKVTKKETGLGLPITKKIIEAHGGLIKVISKVGKGTSFSLFLPCRAASKEGQKNGMCGSRKRND